MSDPRPATDDQIDLWLLEIWPLSDRFRPECDKRMLAMADRIAADAARIRALEEAVKAAYLAGHEAGWIASFNAHNIRMGALAPAPPPAGKVG